MKHILTFEERVARFQALQKARKASEQAARAKRRKQRQRQSYHEYYVFNERPMQFDDGPSIEHPVYLDELARMNKYVAANKMRTHIRDTW